jgi:hypothetical protein
MTLRMLVLTSVLFGALGGRALAQTAGTPAAPDPSSRISLQTSLSSNQAWGAGVNSDGSGPGANVQLGYDRFLTPADAVGLVVGAGIDGVPYGLDADSRTWMNAGVRYTRALRFERAPTLAPFVSPALLFGRTGGELARRDWITSLGLDVGVEWRVLRHHSFDIRVLDRLSRISGNEYGVWHNSIGAMLGMGVRF